MTSGYTRKLTCRHMKHDNICPRCGRFDEFVTHDIFECLLLYKYEPYKLHFSSEHFPCFNIYTNMDYLFRRKISIEYSDLVSDHCRWIILYLLKPRNDKLFRGIDKDPLELIRYAEGEC